MKKRKQRKAVWKERKKEKEGKRGNEIRRTTRQCEARLGKGQGK